MGPMVERRPAGRDRAYIKRDEAESLKGYRYPGTDDRSLWYNHVLTPLAARLVSVMPCWLAPNTITISGLSLVAVSTAVMCCYLPDFQGAAPSWVYVNLSLSLLVYQLLDVCDGQQARKTGNGSPLGLLFDHGCDALNMMISTIALATSLQLGPTWQSIAMMMANMAAFFTTTWEEHFTGKLHLPVINGPNEGCLITAAVHMANAIWGPDFWLAASPAAFGLKYNTMAFMSAIVGTVVAMAMNVRTVYAHARRQGYDTFKALVSCWPFASLVLGLLCWLRWSPTDIARHHSWLLMWGAGLISCKLIMHVMVSHMCATNLNLMRKTLIPIFLCGMHALFQCPTGIVPGPYCVQPILPEAMVAKLLMVLCVVTYFHMVYHLTSEVKTILGINCFKVKPSKTSQNL